MDSDDDLANVEIVVDTGDSIRNAAPLIAPRSARPEQMALLEAPPTAAIAASMDASAMSQAAQLVSFLASNSRRVLSVAFLGFTQHGKTTLVHRALGKPQGSNDADDNVRGMTTQCRVHSTAIHGNVHKTSMLCTAIDTPGEPSFAADASAGLLLATNVVLCVDAVEGLHPAAERLLIRAIEEKARICLAVTKLDRIVTELRLPTKDAYRHIKAIVDSINVVMVKHGRSALSVPMGDVFFVSAKFDLFVSVPQMAAKYAREFGVDAAALASRLWGNVSFDAATRRFVPNAAKANTPATSSFVQFVLEPIYKVFAATLSGHNTFVSNSNHDSPIDAVRDAVISSFGDFERAFSDGILARFPAAHDSASTRTAERMDAWCAHTGNPAPKLFAVAPLLLDSGSEALLTLVRVERGVLKSGEKIQLESGFGRPFECQVGALSVRTRDGAVAVSSAVAGAVVLVEGIADSVRPGMTVLFGEGDAVPEDPLVSRSIASTAAVRVALEPIHVASATQLKQSLRKAVSLHAACEHFLEETGDHVLVGSSELYVDIVLHDLRRRYCGSAHPLRLSDPYVAFAETVAAGPRGMLRTVTGDNGLSLSMAAGPASREVASAFECGALSMITARAELEESLARLHQWDELECSGLAAVGPDPHFGTAFLINDMLGASIGAAKNDDELPAEVMKAIIKGFREATRRGPLCGESLRAVKLYLVNVTLPTGRINLQTLNAVTKLTRQLTRAAILSAAPRLLEPYLAVDIVTKPIHAEAIRDVLVRRRGGITTEVRLSATPLCRLQCVVPVIDAFGLDTEIRLKTGGQTLATSILSHWAPVPGDPMDDSVALLPLQAASGAQLARDFTMKARRRRGLPDVIEVL
jgi:U5 small nuclear ribonucleoprotein component